MQIVETECGPIAVDLEIKRRPWSRRPSTLYHVLFSVALQLLAGPDPDSWFERPAP